jgi:asparagine synthase (glutamine-hydrolysing)
MSAILGRWSFDQQDRRNDCLAGMDSSIAPLGPDRLGSYVSEETKIFFHEFRTTPESTEQPLVTSQGAVVCFDGRLDNREELIAALGCLDSGCADALIVGAAYQRWHEDCFARLIGDWALSIWNPRERAVLLAKDSVGIRHLYFLLDSSSLCWSTALEPLVLLARNSLALDEEYLAGLLSRFPAPDRTPFAAIEAVSPASFVRIGVRKKSVHRYWDFDPGKQIRYRQDSEYEDHFRELFSKSIRRRLRSNAPVAAELSGGIDSTSIVSMADLVRKVECACPGPVKTVSYYDDSEPDWDERPYFTLVERKRGISGCHINAAGGETLFREYHGRQFPATPWSGLEPLPMENLFASYLASSGCRVLLSGLGGDQVLGGVPTALPELADLLSRTQVVRFAAQSIDWALAERTTVWHLIANTVRPFLPRPASLASPSFRTPGWIRPQFAKRNEKALTGYRPRLRVFGGRPSFQENLIALDGVRRELAARPPSPDPLCERRYPYLDRDLLEFIYAVPREQLLRPGERRSLMRRALAGIVPDPVLHRRRKAVVTRRSRAAFLSNSVARANLAQEMLSDSIGVIDAGLFRKALDDSVHDREAQIVPLLRVLALEGWLRALAQADAGRIVWPPEANSEDRERFFFRGLSSRSLS